MIEPTCRDLPLPSGITYRALEWDADSDHTVVLVHGFLDLAWSFRRTVEAGLAGRFHVVAPDMRGHGDSGRVGAGGYYHFMDYLGDLHGVVAALGRGTVSLVGHSMGGAVCSYYAGAFPDQIARLAVLEGLGPPELGTPMPERVRSWIAGVDAARTRGPRVLTDLDEAAARLRAHDPLCPPELARELAERGTEPTEGGVKFKHDPLHLTRGPYPFRLDLAIELWRNIRCPVLLVEGGESVLPFPRAELERRVAALCNAARVDTVVLEGAAHMMHRHRPRELGALLAGFLAGSRDA